MSCRFLYKTEVLKCVSYSPMHPFPSNIEHQRFLHKLDRQEGDFKGIRFIVCRSEKRFSFRIIVFNVCFDDLGLRNCSWIFVYNGKMF